MNKFKLKACIFVALPLFIIGCGGGAKSPSSTSTTPASVTVNCPNGSTSTAATVALAGQSCAQPILLAVSPTNGTNTVSPATFAGVQVTTDSELSWLPLIAAGNVALKVGSLTNVPGQTYLTTNKSFKFVPTAQLQYGITYNFAAVMQDTLGRTFIVNTTFTTASAVCVLPAVWNGASCAVPPVTVICPNGSSSTASTQLLAEAACPAPVLLSVTPANGMTNVSTTSSVTVVTDSVLNPASLTANVILSTGGVAVTGVSVMQAGGKGFIFTPSSSLQYNTVYNLTTLDVTDTLSKAVSVNSSFATVVQVSCTLPAMVNSNNVCMSPPAPTGYTWNSVLRAWVADVGTLVVGANVLPDTCVLVGDACWNDSIANGTIKLVNSGVVMTGVNTRPILFAYFQIGNNGTIGAGYYNTKAIYGDVQSLSPLNQVIMSGASGNVTTEVKGTNVGIKSNIPPFGCYEFVWKSTFFGMNTSTCPL